MDIEPLQECHCEGCEECGDDGAGHFYPCIRHEGVHQYEYYPHEEEWYDINKDLLYRSEEVGDAHLIEQCGDEHRDARHEDDEYRGEEEDSNIVGEGAHYVAAVLGVPYRIERLFYTSCEHHYCVEHEHKTDTEDYSALGVFEVTVHKTDYQFCYLWL